MTDPMDFHALADGELAPAEANALRETVKADPHAAGELNAILNLKDVLANNSVRHTDEEAWRGCLARLDAIDKTRRVEGFVGRYAWAICGLMFVFILSGRFAMRNLDGASATATDFAGVFSRSARPLSKEARLQQKEYRDLLSSVGKSLDPNEVQQVGLPEIGRFSDFPAARFVLRDQTGDLVLTRVDGHLTIVDTAPLGTNSDLSSGVVDGNNLLVWHVGDQTYLLSGDRSLTSLGAFASRTLGAR